MEIQIVIWVVHLPGWVAEVRLSLSALGVTWPEEVVVAVVMMGSARASLTGQPRDHRL